MYIGRKSEGVIIISKTKRGVFEVTPSRKKFHHVMSLSIG